MLQIFRGLVKCVRQLHETRRIHGDLKPPNIVRYESDAQSSRRDTSVLTHDEWQTSEWRLIDMDRSVSSGGDDMDRPVCEGLSGVEDVICGSEGYAVPPELAEKIWAGEPADRKLKKKTIRAHTSLDIW